MQVLFCFVGNKMVEEVTEGPNGIEIRKFIMKIYLAYIKSSGTYGWQSEKCFTV